MNKDFVAIVGLFILVGFVWSITGGPARNISLPKFDTTFESSSINEEETVLTSLEDSSSFKGKVTIQKTSSNIRETKASEEYIVIEAYRKNEHPINITGWELRSLVSKAKYIIPQATNLARTGQYTSDVLLNAWDRAIIVTGRSPVGESFRTNICTGYFGQFQEFFPSLEKKCPYPEDEIGSNIFTGECTEFIEDLYRCEMRIEQIPIQLTDSCHNFINTKLNYNGCVEEHKSDENFYGSEWRLFLGRDTEIWQDRREIIALFDREGNLVDTVTY